MVGEVTGLQTCPRTTGGGAATGEIKRFACHEKGERLEGVQVG